MCIKELVTRTDNAAHMASNKYRNAEFLRNFEVETESESHISVKCGSNCIYILISHNSSVHFESIYIQKDETDESTRMQEFLMEALYVENGIVIIKIDSNLKLHVFAKNNKSEYLNFVLEQQLWTADNQDGPQSARDQRILAKNFETTFNNQFYVPAIDYP